MIALTYKSTFAFCLMALLAVSGTEAKEQQDKMARIQVATVHNFPFIVQLRNSNGEFVCSGALISPTDVLTAAECFDSHDYTKMVVVAGASKVNDAGVERSIAKVTKHPVSNAAVLKLNEAMPLEAGKIGVIALLEDNLSEDQHIGIMGWRHIAALENNSGDMIATRLQVSPQEACEKEFNATAEKNIFCVTGVFDTQFCVGDLGSPAVTSSKKLAGITNAAHKCNEVEHITSFTNIHNIRSFVEEAMK